MELVYVHKSLLSHFIPRNSERLTLRHRVPFQAACLPAAFLSKPHARTNTRHDIAKAIPKRRVKCFTLEINKGHLEDTSRKPEFGTSGSPSVPDYSVEYCLRTDDKAKLLKPSSISASNPVGSKKVAIAKIFTPNEMSAPPCRPLVVRWPVSALQTMLTIPQK